MIRRLTCPEEKLGWIFSVFDKDQVGSIDALDIREVLIRSTDELVATETFFGIMSVWSLVKSPPRKND